MRRSRGLRRRLRELDPRAPRPCAPERRRARAGERRRRHAASSSRTMPPRADGQAAPRRRPQLPPDEVHRGVDPPRAPPPPDPLQRTARPRRTRTPAPGCHRTRRGAVPRPERPGPRLGHAPEDRRGEAGEAPPARGREAYGADQQPVRHLQVGVGIDVLPQATPRRAAQLLRCEQALPHHGRASEHPPPVRSGAAAVWAPRDPARSGARRADAATGAEDASEAPSIGSRGPLRGVDHPEGELPQAMAFLRFASMAARKSSVVSHGLVLGDEQREVLGHLAALDGLDETSSSVSAKSMTSGVPSSLPRCARPPRPGVDRGDRVGRGRLALLVLAVVPGDGAVRGLGLDGLAVGRHQHRGHQAERAEALRDGVGLHVAVVVLAGPDVAALPLERRRRPCRRSGGARR